MRKQNNIQCKRFIFKLVAFCLAQMLCSSSACEARDMPSYYSEERLQAFLTGKPEFVTPNVPAQPDRGKATTCDVKHGCSLPQGPDFNAFMKEFVAKSNCRFKSAVDLATNGQDSANIHKTVLYCRYTKDGRLIDAKIVARPSQPDTVDRTLLQLWKGVRVSTPFPVDAPDEVDIELTVKSTGLLKHGGNKRDAVEDGTACSTVTGRLVGVKRVLPPSAQEGEDAPAK